MPSTSQSLVMGVVSALPVKLIEPFTRSLRQTSYRGRICILADRMSTMDVTRLRELADDVVELDEQYRSSTYPRRRVAILSRFRNTRRLRRIYPQLFQLAGAVFTSVNTRRGLEYALEGLQSLRYAHYLDYLRQNDADRVLITDLRDVLFQDDPFSNEGAALEVVLEDKHVTIGAEPFNRRWIRGLYGRRVLNELANQTVSCSGTVLGTRDGMLRYLDRMANEIARQTRPLGSHDQAIHNHLLRRGALDPVVIHQNEVGPVLTMGQQRDINVRDGVVRNADGSTVAILHQYDRHPHLFCKIRATAVI